MADPDDRDDLEDRIDRLEDTLEELRDAVERDDRVETGRRRPGKQPGETALRLTERLVVPAAVAALEANVRVLTFVQERLRELEQRDPGEAPAEISEQVLDRLDDALVRMEDAIAEADLPANAEARQLLERARDLNEEVRERVGDAGPDRPSGDDVVTIDVEAELDQVKDEVEGEDDEE